MSTLNIPDSLDINDVIEKVEKDKEVFLFNPIEGTFDMALKFNTNRIVTATKSGKAEITDPNEDSFSIITDSNGNVVVV